MSVEAAPRALHWSLPIARAIPSAVLAAVITFSPNHSASFGLVAFGVFALVSGALIAALATRAVPERTSARLVLAHGVLTALAGVGALVGMTAGVAYLLGLVVTWAVLTGVLELAFALRGRRRIDGTRDSLFAGILTLALAAVLVFLPPDLVVEFSGIEGVSGTLTSSIVAVGVIGAYAAVLAVFLIIGGLSLRWVSSAAPTSAEVTPR
ncbi:hypothetical protein CLV46_3285 [Diaminobutyricimonas aerilata]|uniref:Uncharacterized protein n=1 Tax=Diaminobutyricimonas aerilata TaxID=1162967 RepID=A0A2M9CP66_9MICO|nr:hypothetical protein [Diaminobutyricimonas aerilata]PJJ73689.1 hypothetical protein CLV46_3285 [Diaminobutyricimonas aerilata]